MIPRKTAVVSGVGAVLVIAGVVLLNTNTHTKTAPSSTGTVTSISLSTPTHTPSLSPPPPPPPPLTQSLSRSTSSPSTSTCTPVTIKTLPNKSQMVDWSVRSTCIGTRPVTLTRSFYSQRLGVELCYLTVGHPSADSCVGDLITLDQWCKTLRNLPIPPVKAGTVNPPHPGEGEPGGPPIYASLCGV